MVIQLDLDYFKFDKYIHMYLGNDEKTIFIENKTDWINHNVETFREALHSPYTLHPSDFKRIRDRLDFWYSFAMPMASGGVRYLVETTIEAELLKKAMKSYINGKFKKVEL